MQIAIRKVRVRLAGDTQLGEDALVDGGRESPSLTRILIGNFVSDMVGYGEVVRVSGDKVHPVDTEEVDED